MRTHTHNPEREHCIGFSLGSTAPLKLWSDERRRAVSIGPEHGRGWWRVPVVCVPDAGSPARRGAKGHGSGLWMGWAASRHCGLMALE